jgi:hypothetical protein
MSLLSRIKALEERRESYGQAEFVFRKEGESEGEAYARGKNQFPDSKLLIIVSWVSPNENN